MDRFKPAEKGVNVRASRPRQRRRVLRERDAALQEEVREVGNPLGAEEASALREAEREAQAQGDPGSQEDAPQTLGGASRHDVAIRPAEDGADLRALEFDVVLRLISSLARTPPGREAVLRTTPSWDEPSVRRRLEEFSELREFRALEGRLPVAGLQDLSTPLSILESSGGAAAPEDFRPIVSSAKAAQAVRRALARVESRNLSERGERLPDLQPLVDAAARIIGSDGAVRDDASTELLGVRRRLRRRRTEVSRRLEKMLETRRDALADSVVVLRNDRYCLPVAASARGRIAGIVHDRSGSGQTVFVEPLEVVEANNELALAVAEERREVERLLTELGRDVLDRAGALVAAVGEVAELDALEAAVEFGEVCGGRAPEISDDGSWTLVAGRHPLLDPRLADLRRRSLGESREAKEAVPLDLALPAEKRLLVVSGPNAGGKTVVLKTAGLLSLMAQAGLPIPAGRGTRLPVFASVHTEIGDAQEILSDRSTFSSSMETLARILETGATDQLALVDEIGSATDPEEGGALAVAFLEEYLARGGRAIVTTHLSAIKAFAGARDDAVGAAMEFDEATGRPTYRLHPGLSGRSHALSVAARQGLPASVLARARELLGTAWERRDQAESGAEAALERLRRAEEDLARERENAQRESERLLAERDAAARERERMLEAGLAGFERAKKELARRVDSEIEAIREEAARRASESAAQVISRAEEEAAAGVVVQAREERLARARALTAGDRARLRGTRSEGTVGSVEGDSAWLEVAGKRLQVPLSELERIEGAARPALSPRGTGKGARGITEPQAADLAVSTPEVNVIGQHLEEAIAEVEKALDGALLAGAVRFRVVHGHGTGRLRDGLRDHLRRHPAVSRLRAADPREGGNGATIVELT
jgi:DNA mismatch repair protein MutS2